MNFVQNSVQEFGGFTIIHVADGTGFCLNPYRNDA